MELEKTPSGSFDYDGEHFLIRYLDADGQVEMTLAWVEEQKQFVVTSLVVYVSVSKVNKHFRRDYWTQEVFSHHIWIHSWISFVFVLCISLSPVKKSW